jgi:hypothetical protein
MLGDANAAAKTANVLRRSVRFMALSWADISRTVLPGGRAGSEQIAWLRHRKAAGKDVRDHSMPDVFSHAAIANIVEMKTISRIRY